MRIGIDARFLSATSSGLAHYSENLIEALARQDAANAFVVFVHASFKRKLKLGDNFRLVPLGGHPLSPGGMLRMSAALRREALDLLHVHFPLAPAFNPVPTMITVHDVLPFCPEAVDFLEHFRLWRWLQRYAFFPLSLRRAKWIVCVSWATRDELCRLFPEIFHNTTVIHSGVSESFSNPVEPATVDLIRSRLNLPEQYLLYSGSARADKNIQLMIRAFAMLMQRRADLKDLNFVLEIAGGDAQLPQIEKLCRQVGLSERVRILRNLGDDERRVIFELARVLILLSRHEGFGFPIIEAQSCGVPVIAAEAGALPEIAGEGALMADPDDLEGIVAMFENLLTDEKLREYLVKQGKENVKRFDWDRAAELHLQMYQLLF